MPKINVPYFLSPTNTKYYFSTGPNVGVTNGKPLLFLGHNWIRQLEESGNVMISDYDCSDLYLYTKIKKVGTPIFLKSGFSLIHANTVTSRLYYDEVFLGDNEGNPVYIKNSNGNVPALFYSGYSSLAGIADYTIYTFAMNSDKDWSDMTFYQLFDGTSSSRLFWYGFYNAALKGYNGISLSQGINLSFSSGSISFFKLNGEEYRTLSAIDAKDLWGQILFDIAYPESYTKKFNQFSEVDPDNPSGGNPYEPGGESSTSGGNGTFDSNSDPIPFTTLPSLSAQNSGFVGLYSPTIIQLQNLANYLWNENLNLDQLKKLVANPIDLLISLTIVPYSPLVTTSDTIKVGFIDTGIVVNKVNNQFVSVSCGSIEVQKFYGSAIDYSPFTKISIYLPFIGLRSLNVDEIMGATIQVQYNIDLFTGACIAEIMVNNAVMYSFNGNVATQIPLFSESFDSAFSALVGVVSTVGMVAATSGAGAGAAAESSAGITGAQALSIGTSSVNAIMSAKPNIEHTGSMAGNIGFMGQKTPYLIYEIPRMSMPQSYQQYVGFPSNITAKLGDLTGFTVVSQIHLDNIPATSEELKEIESLLMGGVII